MVWAIYLNLLIVNYFVFVIFLFTHKKTDCHHLPFGKIKQSVVN